MKILEEKIKNFLECNYSDTGYGFGYSGSGYSCSGSGSGSGYGFGDNSGYLSFGSGSGYGDGYGYDGYGYGDGYSDWRTKIRTYNRKNVYLIDDVPTLITNIKGNIAKGFILERSLKIKPCYIAKGQNKFAHGETIQEAVRDLEEKILEDLDVEEAIEQFTNKFKYDKKYKGNEFYKWHHILTGSCKMGRETFVIDNSINLEQEYSVEEFINLTKNSYGGEIILKLEEHYIGGLND